MFAFEFKQWSVVPVSFLIQDRAIETRIGSTCGRQEFRPRQALFVLSAKKTFAPLAACRTLRRPNRACAAVQKKSAMSRNNSGNNIAGVMMADAGSARRTLLHTARPKTGISIEFTRCLFRSTPFRVREAAFPAFADRNGATMPMGHMHSA